MKKISAVLGLLILLLAGLAFANTATLTSVVGTVQAQTGTAPARVLRLGDQVRQADTVITGAGSSAVLRFDDGQVAALTANSRMTITAYQYNPQTQSGNVLLSLLTGGMRAITGLIGNRSPANVAYRTATATIGIRGTDITIVTSGGNVIVTVNAGVISFQQVDRNGNRIGNAATVTQGQAGAVVNGQTFSGPAAAIIANLPPAVAAAVAGVTAQLTTTLSDAINRALSGTSGANTTQTIGVGTNTALQPAGGNSSLQGPAVCSVSGSTSVCTCPPIANASFVLSGQFCYYTCGSRPPGGITGKVVAVTNDACASGG